MNQLIIAGVDEAGRGCLAGPVVSAAVVLKKGCILPSGIKDSKKLSIKKRAELRQEIVKTCHIGIGLCEPEVIEDINILKAALLSMKKAVLDLSAKTPIDEVWVDGNQSIKDLDFTQKLWIGGDKEHPIIGAASIIAKVYRDEIMTSLSLNYPGYGLALHKGYGTKFHLEAIKAYGVSDIHRKTFSGVKEHLSI